MAYFPLFVDLEHQWCLIVGGGPVACRKAQVLAEYGAGIIAVSPVFVPEFYVHTDFQLLERKFRNEDLIGIDLVITATDDKDENRRIGELCKVKKLPVNVADDRNACSFLFPALIRDEGITVGITTGGDSPDVAKLLKERFRSVMPEGLGRYAASVGEIRADLIQSETPEVRRAVFKGLAERGMMEAMLPDVPSGTGKKTGTEE